jgi:hypothetical protein
MTLPIGLTWGVQFSVLLLCLHKFFDLNSQLCESFMNTSVQV